MLLAALPSIAAALSFQAEPMPVRGLHLFLPGPELVTRTAKFIREVLPKEGINTLVLEFDYAFKFKKRPEMIDEGALTMEQVKELVQACKDGKVRLIPQINLLGHQSWAKKTGKLLLAHPEFDETPGKYPDNEGIYCRSYCPLHPQVHEVIFDLLDEIADACEADAFHVGMDEVFILADPDCPRCKGKSTAELYAGEVTKLRDHLKSKGREIWMWGDRFLDGGLMGLGEWEAAKNKTDAAINLVPKDVVICDWHYERPEPTAVYFAMNGFRVVSSPWRKVDVALGQLELMKLVRGGASKTLAGRMRGMLHTTWCGAGPFLNAYYGEGEASKEAKESAECFKRLCKAMRE
jgi:hypothetical protein